MKKTDHFRRKLRTIPKYPRTGPPYRVHWNWDISYKCNFSCSYCEAIHRDSEYEYRNIDFSQWVEIFDRIFKLYWSTHFRFSGGEPTIYPGFLDFLGVLLKKNTADITTNLSFDMNEFLDKVPSHSGLSISSSFHPEYQKMEPFLKIIIYLHQNGYPSTISYVAYPPHLSKISEYKKRVEGEGIYFKIIPFSGKYNGKTYPESYTDDEKSILEGFSKDSEDEHLNEINTRWHEHHISEKKEDKIKRGLPCQMGQMYAIIHPDYEVTRCCAGYHGKDSGILGNITDKDFRLLDKPEPCKASVECPCFKAMIVGDEKNKKWQSLWEALEHPVYKTEYMIEYVNYLKENKVKKKDE